MLRLISLLFVLLAGAAPAQEVTLNPTGALMGGHDLAIGWTGPDAQGDWIGLARPGSAGTDWVGNSYAYTSAGNPLTVPLPLDGGSFELRYVGADNTIRAALPITVIAGSLPSVALTPMSAEAGAAIQVPLGADAPRAAGDYLYISPAGSADDDYSGGYVPIPAEGPVAISAPATPGDWELRYVVSRGGSYLPVGRAALTVSATPGK